MLFKVEVYYCGYLTYLVISDMTNNNQKSLLIINKLSSFQDIAHLTTSFLNPIFNGWYSYNRLLAYFFYITIRIGTVVVLVYMSCRFAYK